MSNDKKLGEILEIADHISGLSILLQAQAEYQLPIPTGALRLNAVLANTLQAKVHQLDDEQ